MFKAKAINIKKEKHAWRGLFLGNNKKKCSLRFSASLREHVHARFDMCMCIKHQKGMKIYFQFDREPSKRTFEQREHCELSALKVKGRMAKHKKAGEGWLWRGRLIHSHLRGWKFVISLCIWLTTLTLRWSRRDKQKFSPCLIVKVRPMQTRNCDLWAELKI